SDELKVSGMADRKSQSWVLRRHPSGGYGVFNLESGLGINIPQNIHRKSQILIQWGTNLDENPHNMIWTFRKAGDSYQILCPDRNCAVAAGQADGGRTPVAISSPPGGGMEERWRLVEADTIVPDRSRPPADRPSTPPAAKPLETITNTLGMKLTLIPEG